MNRYFKVFIFQIAVIAGLLSAGITLASDGDVNYSAPYITVDPETGKLITVNPGPKLKVHEPIAANETTPDLTSATDAQTTVSGPTLDNNSEQQTRSIPVITTLAVVILISAGLFVIRSRQRRKNALSDSTEFVRESGSL